MAGRYLTDDPIDVTGLMSSVMRESDGALALFAGAVRNHHEGKSVESIFYDAYRPMAEKEIDTILDEIRQANPMVRIVLVHRLGLLTVGDVSIAIACSSPHRKDAFAACRQAIDRVKQTVPIWKKEKSKTGEEWVGWQGRSTSSPENVRAGESYPVSVSQLPVGAGSSREEVAITPAASTIVVRDDPYEVLLYRRNLKSSFVPGAWVFPGGSVEQSDVELAKSIGVTGVDVMRVCALRELLEESGLWLGEKSDQVVERRDDLVHARISFNELMGGITMPLEKLTWTARWITPAGVPKRFDTFFFIANASRELTATADGIEGIEVLWISPAGALELQRRGELQLMFPTMKTLEAIAAFSSSSALIDSRKGLEVATTRPVLIVDGDKKRIVLPSDENETGPSS